LDSIDNKEGEDRGVGYGDCDGKNTLESDDCGTLGEELSLASFFGGGQGLSSEPCIYYALSLSTELS